MNLKKITPSLSMLMAFEASARLGSFTKAAHELSLTQGAISRQVTALEGALDLPLFIRCGRHIELTEVGRRYALDIAPALARIRGASTRALAFYGGEGGQLNLGALPTFASRWLVPKLASFYQQHPNMVVHIHSRIGEYVLQGTGLDAAINVGVEPFSGLLSERIVPEEMIIVCSPKLLVRNPVRSIEDLFSFRLLHIMARSEAWRELATQYQINPKSALAGPQFETTIHLIQAAVLGIGIGLVARCLVENELNSKELVELPFKGLSAKRDYCLLYSPDKEGHPVLQAFRAWLADQIIESHSL
ncbi:LysR substrate-binding domain-containing protein [Neptunomonas phycophila]|uniref:LysR substrate-binding domain-containing protein n=1 Tax=Neptunomonas phycophila TaxID=1572645 RepID=UPI0037369470